MALVTVWNLQYYQPMVLNSLVCSLIPVAITVLLAQPEGGTRFKGILPNLVRAFLKILGTLVAACLLSTTVKVCDSTPDMLLLLLE